jgi:hypothetical protein
VFRKAGTGWNEAGALSLFRAVALAALAELAHRPCFTLLVLRGVFDIARREFAARTGRGTAPVRLLLRVSISSRLPAIAVSLINRDTSPAAKLPLILKDNRPI